MPSADDRVAVSATPAGIEEDIASGKGRRKHTIEHHKRRYTRAGARKVWNLVYDVHGRKKMEDKFKEETRLERDMKQRDT